MPISTTLKSRTAGAVNRRVVLARLLASGAASGIWSTAEAQRVLLAQNPAAPLPWKASHARALRAAADTIVPRTHLPGAVQAGVPFLIEQLVRYWMSDAEQRGFAAGLEHLDALALETDKKLFSACSAKQRQRLMEALRQEAPYKGNAVTLAGRLLDARLPFYLRLRDLVFFCYFNSQAGATQATRYLPAPGSYQGDVSTKDWPYQMVL